MTMVMHILLQTEYFPHIYTSLSGAIQEGIFPSAILIHLVINNGE